MTRKYSTGLLRGTEWLCICGSELQQKNDPRRRVAMRRERRAGCAASVCRGSEDIGAIRHARNLRSVSEIGVTVDKCMVGDGLHKHGLANAIWSGKDGPIAVLDEYEAEGIPDGLSSDLAGPRPIEPIDGLDGSDPGIASVEAATLPLKLFDVEKPIDPWLSRYFRPRRYSLDFGELASLGSLVFVMSWS